MTVIELINALQELDDHNLPVHFAYNYGDYWNTTVAPEVTLVGEGRVIHSNYHNMDKVVTEEDKQYEDAEDAVILNFRD